MEPRPPDRKLTCVTQLQRVREWLATIDRPEGTRLLDMESGVLLALMQRLDSSSRSSLERTCKSLLSISRSQKPVLQLLSLHFTTTWNHDHFVEITAQFSPEHVFHAVFMCKKKGWMSGGWSTERQKKITSGVFPPEHIFGMTSFVASTSKYIEYWLNSFRIEVLRLRVENLIPGKEGAVHRMHFSGTVPPLKLKKLVVHGLNNTRLVTCFLDRIRVDPKEKLEMELLDVARPNHIFCHPLLTSGLVDVVRFVRHRAHFTRKSLSFLNASVVSVVVRKVPSEAVNTLLKRWSRGELTEEFRLLHVTETTRWSEQEMDIETILGGLNVRHVQLKTDVPLKVLELSARSDPPSAVLQIYGPRTAFCTLCDNELVFEAPPTCVLPRIAFSSSTTHNTYDQYERQKNRLYVELFRRRIVQFFD